MYSNARYPAVWPMSGQYAKKVFIKVLTVQKSLSLTALHSLTVAFLTNDTKITALESYLQYLLMQMTRFWCNSVYQYLFVNLLNVPYDEEYCVKKDGFWRFVVCEHVCCTLWATERLSSVCMVVTSGCLHARYLNKIHVFVLAGGLLCSLVSQITTCWMNQKPKHFLINKKTQRNTFDRTHIGLGLKLGLGWGLGLWLGLGLGLVTLLSLGLLSVHVHEWLFMRTARLARSINGETIKRMRRENKTTAIIVITSLDRRRFIPDDYSDLNSQSLTAPNCSAPRLPNSSTAARQNICRASSRWNNARC